MAQNKYNLNVAFQACTRRVMQPGHINILPVEYHHFPQFFLPPQGEAERDEADDYLQILNCIMMEDGPHGLSTFRDFERYRIPDNSDEESEVPTDDSDEESEVDDEDE